MENRGLALIKTGFLEEGTADLEASISIDDKHAETYRNLGIYYLLKKDFDQALILFEKSREIVPDTKDIDRHIKDSKPGGKN